MKKTIELSKSGNSQLFGDYDIQLGRVEFDGEFIKVDFTLDISTLNIDEFITDLKELIGANND